MVAVVPSLNGQLLLKDPQSIIAATWNRYSRTPAQTIPILSDLIISLPDTSSRFGNNPDGLINQIQSEFQGVLQRIFGNDRTITVNASYSLNDDQSDYNVNVSVSYTDPNGPGGMIGTSIRIKDGYLSYPDQIVTNTLS